MTVDMSPEAIWARLQYVSSISDLDRDKRLHGKIDYSPEAVRARLIEVGRLLDLCRALSDAVPVDPER